MLKKPFSQRPRPLTDERRPCLTTRYYKIYSPEKFKAQYEAELAAKRAERKKKRTVTVEQNGKQVEKEVTLGEANKLRLERARQLEAELYKDERTTPLNKD